MGMVIVATGLERTFGTGTAATHALRGASLTVAASEFVLLRGRSGSGKTTLLSILGGLDVPDAGEITIDGQDPAQLRPREREAFWAATVGWVFQASGLLPLLTALQNVALPLLALDVPDADANERASRALAAVGLSARAEHLASELSGGEQQRVAIARAIAKEPRLLLADEPTSQLDGETSTGVLSLLRDVADAGTAVLVAAHDDRAAELADRVLSIEDGQVAAWSAPPPA